MARSAWPRADMAKPESWRLDCAHYPFKVAIPTRWADLDLLGHINNVSMAGLFDEGRGRFNRALALDRPHGVRWLIARVDLAYLAEAHHPEDVTLASGIVRIGTASWTIASAAFQKDGCVATADTTIVYTDGSGSQPIPDAFRQRLGTMMAGKPA